MIIVGFSDSAEGRVALERAAEEALLRSAALLVVNAVAAPTSESRGEIEAWRARMNQVRNQAKVLQTHLKDRGVDASVVVEVAERQSPAQVLLQASIEHCAELLVIGIRSRSRVGKAVFGSTDQDVILGADCPVLAVKAREVI